MWGLELYNAAGQKTFGIGDATALQVGEFAVTGKTASSIGNPDGWRNFTLPGVPANTSIWWMMTLYDAAGTLASTYYATAQQLSNDTFRYRIDLAAAGAVTVIEYGWKAL